MHNDGDEDWSTVLNNHPIFSLPKSFTGPLAQPLSSLELSTNSLSSFTNVDPQEDGAAPSGRRQVMVLKDADVIVAAGKELRLTSLGDTKLGRSARKTYKTLHTPNVQFEIHQLALNPSGKLLAVAGAFQVAIVVLPRPGVTRLVPEVIDCKSIQIGQFYHASTSSAPIAKIEWHPWGEAGSTLMVMTVDGKLREYDISVDTEEPQQVLSFVPERKFKSYVAEDASEREVVSFTLGKGRADWGPLTVYALMRSGDVYAICPYMPQNASISSSYVHALECFVAAKQEFLAQGTSHSDAESSANSLSTMYDYQQKYISALTKQLPPGTIFPSTSRSVLMHPPKTVQARPLRQGPFLLQPAPRILEGSEGGDATDITYLLFGTEDEDVVKEGEPEHLGVVLVAFQDGKVDVCLDVEKIEARWETKAPSPDLPMLAVYETIDLGIVSSLNTLVSLPNEPSALDLLQGNHIVFSTDPLHDDIVYAYHAFGVHALHLGPILQSLITALRADENDSDDGVSTKSSALETSAGTDVRHILSTFSVERRSSNPVVAVSVPNDVYLTYSIFILTSAMRITTIPLHVRSDSPRPPPKELPAPESNATLNPLVPVDGPPGFVSYLGTESYVPPSILSRPSNGLPSNPHLSLPASNKHDFMLTPDTLRYLGTVVSKFVGQIREVQLAYWAAQTRATLHKREAEHQQQHCTQMLGLLRALREERCKRTADRIDAVREEQKKLLARLDRVLSNMMARASPGLSENERRWFEELKALKQEISGAGRYDEGSLSVRTRQLEKEYARLMPSLKALAEKEKALKNKDVGSNYGLGLSQAFELGERSSAERAKIAKLEEHIQDLASRLDIPLEQPPSL
ncbi:hypothetical protein HGRIS_009689 [Hohenbuehelia grisea]|uniref:Uncharacterized protein n=1 Tax=Hohenbuehelia grisea TaxID=104357 RepID=A0ABR3J3D4_9AGAR